MTVGVGGFEAATQCAARLNHGAHLTSHERTVPRGLGGKYGTCQPLVGPDLQAHFVQYLFRIKFAALEECELALVPVVNKDANARSGSSRSLAFTLERWHPRNTRSATEERACAGQTTKLPRKEKYNERVRRRASSRWDPRSAQQSSGTSHGVCPPRVRTRMLQTGRTPHHLSPSCYRTAQPAPRYLIQMLQQFTTLTLLYHRCIEQHT